MFGRNVKKINVAEQQQQERVKRLIQSYAPPPFTPDLWQLEMRKAHPVFIADDMMQTQPNHKMVAEGGLSGFYPFHYGYTSQRYNFVKKNLGLKSFPIALDLRETDELPAFMVERHRIRGEVYALRAEQIIALDNHRQNGVQFTRTPVTINIGHRKNYKHTTTDSKGNKFIDYSLGREEMTSITAFMYVGREAYWKDQLEAGFFDFSPIDIIQEDRLWLKEYYQYSRVR